ncbi:hypothetical protein [Aeromonas hydrophila]|uniref:hypothetical protein n=1 Tax=Aeromonas hydrophila TaxID=644 RepID=UPI000444ABF4|nr:hypothetical protein [Aeromonas hydrophila]AHX32835.1 hypothetical protein V428_12270 [Aeromonas hydrophila subsp. hydrophila AL09-71]AHX69633.1 hypothetical protein V429_12285 [Aeromonas hydrophila pc104A]AJE38626.1 hypothetical protein V469_10790 [Aeromonas hydrophila J-1]AKJ37054.1 hypothetical protein U876_11200 [Aeromonas hydrophila NJ-35]ALQ63402.1 hypothetical protein AS145_11115 [Aeromonas hydrophila]
MKTIELIMQKYNGMADTLCISPDIPDFMLEPQIDKLVQIGQDLYLCGNLATEDQACAWIHKQLAMVKFTKNIVLLEFVSNFKEITSAWLCEPLSSLVGKIYEFGDVSIYFGENGKLFWYLTSKGVNTKSPLNRTKMDILIGHYYDCPKIIDQVAIDRIISKHYKS